MYADVLFCSPCYCCPFFVFLSVYLFCSIFVSFVLFPLCLLNVYLVPKVTMMCISVPEVMMTCILVPKVTKTNQCCQAFLSVFLFYSIFCIICTLCVGPACLAKKCFSDALASLLVCSRSVFLAGSRVLCGCRAVLIWLMAGDLGGRGVQKPRDVH